MVIFARADWRQGHCDNINPRHYDRFSEVDCTHSADDQLGSTTEVAQTKGPVLVALPPELMFDQASLAVIAAITARCLGSKICFAVHVNSTESGAQLPAWLENRGTPLAQRAGPYATAIIQVLATPVLAITLLLLVLERWFGVGVFDAALGGDPVLFQHFFWFYSHPAVYIMILPAFGAVSHIIPAFSRKPLFGYASMVYAVGAIALLSFVVWAHHMFTVGIPIAGQLFFMYATMLIAVPTGVKVFNWVATMFRGSLTFEAPMLFAVAFVILFTIGGFSGLMLAIAPADFQYHDTYFVVAHFHYVLVPGAIFGIFASAYFWLPKWTGHMYDETLGKTHFWLSFIGMNLAFFPMHFLGLAGMPRRIPDYALQFADFNMVSSIGAFMFGASQILFLVIVIKCVKGGEKASAQPWDGAEGLEWTVPSPAPYHTFATPPEVK